MKHFLLFAVTFLFFTGCKKHCEEYHLKFINNGGGGVQAGTSAWNIIVSAHSDTIVIINSKVDSIFYIHGSLANPAGYKLSEECEQQFDVSP